MAFDSQRGRVVLLTSISGSPPDTWEWDGTSWMMQYPSTAPTPVQGYAMAYDSQRGRTVVFGGQDNGGHRIAETWEWDGTSWTQRTPGSAPPPRYLHAMAYDTLRGRTVVFGGLDNANNALGDTWEWDGANWIPGLSAQFPSPRINHAMVYDSQVARVVLFGGNVNFSPYYAADTWEWNGSTWTQDTSTPAPAGRTLHAMAYDSLRGRVVLFGGLGLPNPLGDTWEWNGGVSSIATAFGSGCGIPPLDLSPITTAPPIIGTTAQASLTNIPSSLAYLALGWSRTTYGPFTLPLTLSGFGLPGCDLLQSAEFAALSVPFTGASAATFSLPVPNMPVLIGLHVYLQGWAYAPGVNPGHTIVSNGIEWDIGNS
jgi:hypothetical protein